MYFRKFSTCRQRPVHDSKKSSLQTNGSRKASSSLGVVKLGRAALATAFFICLLLIVYTLHARLFAVNVVFYAALLDGVIACCLAAAVLWGARWFAALSSFEKWQLCLIWLLQAYAFAISVPTVIDRSLSFYILEKLQQRGGGIQLSHFEDMFVHEYLPEHRLMQVRLTEQQVSGTLVINGDCVRLTERGRKLAGFTRYFRQHFLPRKRLLIREYSDALTDPFRDTPPSPGYEC